MHFKPWKGRISNYVAMIDIENDRSVKEVIEQLKADGKHKRRTITGWTINYTIKL